MPTNETKQYSQVRPGYAAPAGGLGDMRPLPRGEVMATGVINGMSVDLVRYTEEEIRTRDRQWQYEVQRERDAATQAHCRFMNLELDLRRLLDGEDTLNGFDVVEELRQRLDDCAQMEIERLRAALLIVKRMCDEALPKFNWGASRLDANAIKLLNDAPLAVMRALGPNG